MTGNHPQYTYWGEDETRYTTDSQKRRWIRMSRAGDLDYSHVVARKFEKELLQKEKENESSKKNDCCTCTFRGGDSTNEK